MFIVLAGLTLIAGCTGSKPRGQVSGSDSNVAVGSRLPMTGASTAAASELKGKSGRGDNTSESSMIVTPYPMLVGRVVSFNMAGRFVVLNFPVGHLPVLEQQLDLFRHGIKVGEVKITGPQRDDHIVADVTAGEAVPGDEARAR